MTVFRLGLGQWWGVPVALTTLLASVFQQLKFSKLLLLAVAGVPLPLALWLVFEL
ncbi:hypothetical protein ACQ4N7_23325 [Nodosilinea sp. AN01ver1]|uniref:hypothetical protein n=1 Tax=Nodosilinea sp. AN01ver1 TaxID=3423362 RepID=UPI003D31025B